MTRLRTRALVSALLLTFTAGAPLLPAQVSRLDELAAQEMELYRRGEYARATPIAIEEVRVAEALYGPDHPEVAATLNNLAELYRLQGRVAEAQPLYERALRIDEKALGPEHLHVAIDINNLALLCEDQGKYADAEKLFQRSLAIREKAAGPDSTSVAVVLNNLAELYVEQGKFAEAEPLYKRAMHIDEQKRGPESDALAIDLNNLGELYLQQAKYEEAEPLYQRALSIDEKVLGPNHPQIAQALNNLASLYGHESKYPEAEQLYRRCLTILEKSLGPEHPNFAKALNNLGDLYKDEGKYADAESIEKRSLAIREKALGTDHPEVAASLNNLGELYDTQGRYAEAEPLYHRSLTILEKAMGTDHPDVAFALNNLAELYRKQGKYAEAEPLYRRSLAIREKAFGPDHPDVASSLNGLAQLYRMQGRTSDAELLDERCLVIMQNALGPDHPHVADALNNLASVYYDQGKYDKAEPMYERALRINEKALGAEHPDVAVDLNNLAELYRQQGKYEKAEPYYQRALQIDEKMLGPDHPDTDMGLDNLASLYDTEGKYREAEVIYRRDLDSLFHQFQYSFTYATEKDRLEFLNSIAGRFPGYFSFVQRYQQQDPELIGSMYDLLLWEKGFIATSVAGMRRQIETSGDRQAIDLLNQLADRRKQIAALMDVRPSDRDAWRKQINELSVEADEIEKSLVARSAAFAEKSKLDRTTWQQVRDGLGPDDAAVEFARFRYFDKKWAHTYYYVALVVTRQTKDQPRYIVLGESAQIEGSTLTPFQHSVQTRGLEAEAETMLPGTAAYERIWRPLESALKGKKRIYLSSDGALNQISFGLIPTPGGKLLMERYDLRLLSSTKDILRKATTPSVNPALLVGDPAFEMTDAQQRTALEKFSQPSEAHVESAPLSKNDVSRDAADTGSELPPLPGTGAEVNTISKLMQDHGWKANVYLQQAALKRVVEQASGPRVIHLATHGFFLSDQQINTESSDKDSGLEDPMLRSGLYFAGADRTLLGKSTPETQDNGVLTAMEASSLNLSGTELVVLSACNTGRGDVKNGEGVFGLRRGLQEAGAQEILMSLWSVPDKETQELMQSFYSKWLSGTEMHQALKQAELEMREKVKREHDGRDLPYYWGAFVLVGR